MHTELHMSPEWVADAHAAEIKKRDEIIDEQKREIARLEKLAYKDELTGLWNRKGLEKQLQERKYGRPDQKGQIDPQVCLLVLDIDNFKQINDEFGHYVGDAVLAEVGKYLRAGNPEDPNSDAKSHPLIRQTDIVARWGGEEIAIVTEGHDEQGVLEKLFVQTPDDKANNQTGRARVNIPILINGKERIVTLSGGVTNFDATKESYHDAFLRADFALHKAKGRGLPQGQGRDRIIATSQIDPQELAQMEKTSPTLDHEVVTKA